ARGASGPAPPPRSQHSTRPALARSSRRRLSSKIGPLDACAERTQSFVDALVAAVDLADVADRRSPLGAEGGDDHRHTSTDVRALETLPVERCRPRYDSSMRITEDDSRSHRDELVHEEEAALEHLLEDEHGSVRLGRAGERDRGQIGGKRGPDAALDLRYLAAEVVDDLQ